MSECENIEVIYETESITWESDEELMPLEETTKEEKEEKSEKKRKDNSSEKAMPRFTTRTNY